MEGQVHAIRCVACGSAVAEETIQGLCSACLASSLYDWSTDEPAETAAAGADHPLGTAPLVRGANGSFGNYELEAEIAHGGMGVVYRARQRGLNRPVALKLLLLGRFSSTASIQRFLREAESAAQLRHPNIVSIHEIGVHEGLHYFSMDFVEGRSLASLVREGPLAARRAAAYGVLIARAIHHAHQHGIVHRDLKPSNVLIDEADQPRITDFGLAKRFDDQAAMTVSGEMLGSPSYLSPEQASGQHRLVGPASDIYSLGAMLYELLTGRPPFLAESLGATLLQILQSPPLSPRLLNPRLPRDLETICLKCLEKEPARRYPDAAGLAADLERFLQGKPTQARPVGPLGHLVRWTRRRPALAGALGLLAALMVVAAAGGVALSYRATTARRETDVVNARLADQLRELQWQKAETLAANGKVTDALVHFARMARDSPGDPALASRLISLLSSRAFALPIGPPLRHGGPVVSVDFHPRGDRILTGSTDGFATLWDLDGRRLWTASCGSALGRVEFSPDGNWVFTRRGDGASALWEARSGRRVRTFAGHGWAQAVRAFSPDGTRLAVPAGHQDVEVWALEEEPGLRRRWDAGGAVSALAWTPDGEAMVLGTATGQLQIWNVETATRTGPVLELDSAITALEVTPDHALVLAGTQDGRFCVLDRSNPTRVLHESRGGDRVLFIRCQPHGTQVLLNRFGEWTVIWDLGLGREVGVFRRADAEIAMDGKWSLDGRRVLLAYRGGSTTLYDSADRRELLEPFEHEGPVVEADFSPDGTLVATASEDGSARIWRVSETGMGRASWRLPGKVGSQIVRRGTRWLVTATSRNYAYLCDPMTGRPTVPPLVHSADVSQAVLSADGRWVATVGADGLVRIWDSSNGQPTVEALRHGGEVTAVAWSPDGSRLVTANRAGNLLPWVAATGQPAGPGWSIEVGVTALRFSPDGNTLAATCGDASVRIFDPVTGRERFGALRHRGMVRSVEFSPDGRRLVTASVDRTARLWDLATGIPAARPLRHDGAVLVARFSPDGRLVATGSEDRAARLWEAASGRLLAGPLAHLTRVWVVEFSPDGQRLLTSADGNLARVWDVPTGFPLVEPMVHGGQMLRAWFLPDGEEILTATHQATLHRWRIPRAPAPMPDWLPELAEALAGRRLTEKGDTLPASSSVLRHLAGEAPGEGPQDFYTHWARWFVSERERQPLPPWEDPSPSP